VPSLMRFDGRMTPLPQLNHRRSLSRSRGNRQSRTGRRRSGDCRDVAIHRSFCPFAVALVVSILDPDVIVLGGGMSNIELLERELPKRVEAYSFAPEPPSRIVRNIHGDSSGVRGAAGSGAKMICQPACRVEIISC